jgi:diadenosine tetraphosphate (Ap4A) HIT family hydrolase
MALTPDEFYAHALTATDAERRLPLSRMTMWEVAPFEQDGLRVVPLRPPVVPEPPRQDEDPATCQNCASTDDGLWHDEHWRLRRIAGVGVPLALMLEPREHYDFADLPDQRAAEFGVLSRHIAQHIEALPNIARAHLYRIGDGGAHLHIWFFARPLGQGQFYGSWLPVWDDLLPEYPADVAQADAEAVAAALRASYAGVGRTVS